MLKRFNVNALLGSWRASIAPFMSSALEFAGPARKNLPDKSHVAEKGRVSRSETHCQVQMKSKIMSHNVALPIQSQISAKVS